MFYYRKILDSWEDKKNSSTTIFRKTIAFRQLYK